MTVFDSVPNWTFPPPHRNPKEEAFFFLSNKAWNTRSSFFCCIKLCLKEARLVSEKRWIVIFHYFILSLPFSFSELPRWWNNWEGKKWYLVYQLNERMKFLIPSFLASEGIDVLGDQNGSCWEKCQQEWPIYWQGLELSLLKLAKRLKHHTKARNASSLSSYE